MEYETVIGLEVHVQPATRTKMFCSCPVGFGAEPNTQVCPVCLGLPGALPVTNRRALDLALRAALALDADIAQDTRFDRKNYFYPDLPKAYQISQFDAPFCHGGHLTLDRADGGRTIHLVRIHLEEDAGKLVHAPGGGPTAVDLNRCGVPLVEIVTEPQLRSPKEAHRFLTVLRLTLRHAGVSECTMEHGSLRCDANISLRPAGVETLGAKTEIKNLNSFSAVQRALEHEAQRQREVLEKGGVVRQETRLWDDGAGRTRVMRSKEDAQDYRYFPDPDLPVLHIDGDWIARVAASIPERYLARVARYREKLGLSDYDARVVAEQPGTAAYFDAVVACLAETGAGGKQGEPDGAELRRMAKAAVNWVTQDFRAGLNARGQEAGDSPVEPLRLADLIRLVQSGSVVKLKAKEVLERMFDDDRPVEVIVDDLGARAMSGEDALEELAGRAMAADPGTWADYVSGRDKALGGLIGQCMRLSGGTSNPRALSAVFKRLRERAGEALPPGSRESDDN